MRHGEHRSLRARSVHYPSFYGSPWNRDAYLVQGLAPCGTCHAPRKRPDGGVAVALLGGGKAGGWDAPNITSDAKSGIGGWTDTALVRYPGHGDAHEKSQTAGPMAEAIDNSLRHMREDVRGHPPRGTRGSGGARAGLLAAVRPSERNARQLANTTPMNTGLWHIILRSTR